MKKTMLLTSLKGLGVYVITVVLGFCIDFIGEGDFISIIANIITNVYGFICGVIGYGDYFELGGFHVMPFILGGIIWIIVSFLFSYILNMYYKSSNKRKLVFFNIGKILLYSGFIIGLLVIVFSLFIACTRDGMAILFIFYIATIYVPLIIVGIIFIIWAKN